MCLAVPAKIEAIQGEVGEVSLGGNRLRANLSLVENPQVGEYVLVHAGFAIAKYSPEEAAESLAEWAKLMANERHR
jgi:hydrogenase expression/formation protein HypC